MSLAVSARGAKTVETPEILGFVVTEDVEIAVLGANAKISGARRIPAAVKILDVVGAAAKGETQRTFVGAIACVTFDGD
jgi:hypothetical protein